MRRAPTTTRRQGASSGAGHDRRAHFHRGNGRGHVRGSAHAGARTERSLERVGCPCGNVFSIDNQVKAARPSYCENGSLVQKQTPMLISYTTLVFGGVRIFLASEARKQPGPSFPFQSSGWIHRNTIAFLGVVILSSFCSRD